MIARIKGDTDAIARKKWCELYKEPAGLFVAKVHVSEMPMYTLQSALPDFQCLSSNANSSSTATASIPCTTSRISLGFSTESIDRTPLHQLRFPRAGRSCGCDAQGISNHPRQYRQRGQGCPKQRDRIRATNEAQLQQSYRTSRPERSKS